MYCQSCRYELANLEQPVCPECGRAFDQADPRTFDARPGAKRLARLLERVVLATASIPLLANAVAYTALLAARWSLGRWPNRRGADDPKDIAAAYWLTIVALLLVVGSLPALIGYAGCAIRLCVLRPSVRSVLIGLAGAALWAGGFVLARWDGADVWMWILD